MIAAAAAKDVEAGKETDDVGGTWLHGFVLPVAETELPESPFPITLTDRFGATRSKDTRRGGEYGFAIVPPGKYWLCVDIDGGVAQTTLDIESSESERRLDLQLVTARDVLIEVVNQGGEMIPALDALVVATREWPGEWIDVLCNPPSTRFGIGNWSSNLQPETNYPAPVFGRLRLSTSDAVLVSLVHQQRVVATQRLEFGQQRMRFVLDPESKLLQPSSLK